MTRMAGKALVACGVTLALAWGVGAGPAMAQTVRIYNCMHASEDMNKRFEAKLGVKTALLRLSCGEMWARIQAETKEGKDPGGIQADLVFSVLPDQMLSPISSRGASSSAWPSRGR